MSLPLHRRNSIEYGLWYEDMKDTSRDTPIYAYSTYVTVDLRPNPTQTLGGQDSVSESETPYQETLSDVQPTSASTADCSSKPLKGFAYPTSVSTYTTHTTSTVTGVRLSVPSSASQSSVFQPATSLATSTGEPTTPAAPLSTENVRYQATRDPGNSKAIAIGVGTAFGVIILLVVAAFFMFTRRRKQRQSWELSIPFAMCASKSADKDQRTESKRSSANHIHQNYPTGQRVYQHDKPNELSGPVTQMSSSPIPPTYNIPRKPLPADSPLASNPPSQIKRELSVSEHGSKTATGLDGNNNISAVKAEPQSSTTNPGSAAFGDGETAAVSNTNAQDGKMLLRSISPLSNFDLYALPSPRGDHESVSPLSSPALSRVGPVSNDEGLKK